MALCVQAASLARLGCVPVQHHQERCGSIPWAQDRRYSIRPSPLKGLFSGFDSSNTCFALGTADGRVRTFDTVTGRLRSTLASNAAALAHKDTALLPNGHLAEAQRCLTWIDSQKQTQEDGPTRLFSSSVAVGTASGAVRLYDSATGELRWQTANCSEGGVDCLVQSSGRCSTLLGVGRSGHACVLDAATGSKQSQFRASKHGTTAAALSADGSRLLIGGSTLSLLDMDTQQRISKFTGHPLPVRAVAFAPSDAYAVSAAEGERLVAVWATASRPGSKLKSGGAAVASLAVEQPAVGLMTAAADIEGPGSFYAAATTEAGEVYCWLIRPDSDSTAVTSSQLAHVCIKQQAGSSSSHECIMAAALEPALQGITLLLVAGSAAKPRFERLFVSSSGSNSSNVTYLQPAAADGLIRPAAAAAANGPSAGPQQRASRQGAELLGPDNAGDLVQQRVPSSSKSSRKRQEPEPEGVGPSGDGMDADIAAAADVGGADDAEELAALQEPTLGQRVAELEQQHQHQQLAGGLTAPGDQPQQQQQGGISLPAGPLKADSLAVLLSQALHSSDKALLEHCFQVAKERIIANTVKRLVPVDASLLLRAAVERLQSRPARGQQLAAWIHAVLLHHTAYLMAAPGAAPVMSSLFQIIEGRLSMQRQLLSLAGRLDLLLAQAGGQQEARPAAAAGPQVVYQESDSEAEVEVVDAAAGDFSEDESYYTDEGDESDETGDSDASAVDSDESDE